MDQEDYEDEALSDMCDNDNFLLPADDIESEPYEPTDEELNQEADDHYSSIDDDEDDDFTADWPDF